MKWGDVIGRPQQLASFLGLADAKFFVKESDDKQNAKNGPERLVETDAAVGIRTKRGFPPRLEKAKHTTLGFFTVPTSPTAIHLPFTKSAAPQGQHIPSFQEAD
jgi:hypothetical protein